MIPKIYLEFLWGVADDGAPCFWFAKAVPQKMEQFLGEVGEGPLFHHVFCPTPAEPMLSSDKHEKKTGKIHVWGGDKIMKR
jgi:hypothetical protein